jgi:hypothetical protein
MATAKDPTGKIRRMMLPAPARVPSAVKSTSPKIGIQAWEGCSPREKPVLEELFESIYL